MTVRELQERLEFYAAQYSADDDVVVQLSEPSVGITSFTNVTYAGSGFDWDSGRFWITPEKKLLSKEKDRDAELPAVKIIFRETELRHRKLRSIIKCPKCEEHLMKSDKYCSRCGQRIKIGEYREYIR